MAEAKKSPAKKFLVGISILLGIVATLGAVVGLTMERKLPRELRSTVFESVGPQWLETYTFGAPEMLESDLVLDNFDMYYADGLEGDSFRVEAETSKLTASNSKFNVQLQPGDRLIFSKNGEILGEARVTEVLSATQVQLDGALQQHGLAHHSHGSHGGTGGSGVHGGHAGHPEHDGHDGEVHGDAIESVRYMRRFTGVAYRFYGRSGKDGVDTKYDTLEAPVGHHFSEDGILVEGDPVVHDDHGGHGGHGGGHGESYTYSPLVRPGQFQPYHENWPLGKFYRHVKYSCGYKDGLKNGVEAYWQANGHCEWRKKWTDGVLDGTYEEWFSTGIKKLNAVYAGGLLTGEYIAFHHNGEKKIKTHFLKGELHGRLETWNINKNRLFNKMYEHGKEMPKESKSSSAGH